MRSHRIPAGDAGGAVAGMYPDGLAIGCPPLAGWSLWDDFVRIGSSGDYGDSRLATHTIGSSVTPSGQVPAANTEIGILRLTTDVTSTAFEGGTLGVASSPGVYASTIPGGLWYVAKLRIVSATNTQAWSGFAEAQARIYDGGTDGFVGFWGETGSTWKGVVYDGTTWQAVDTGVTADSTWVILAMRVLAKADATTDTRYGVQFYTVNADTPPGWGQEFTEVGALNQLGSEPTGGLTLVAGGVVTTDAATPDRAMEIDFIGVGGPGRR